MIYLHGCNIPIGDYEGLKEAGPTYLKYSYYGWHTLQGHNKQIISNCIGFTDLFANWEYLS